MSIDWLDYMIIVANEWNVFETLGTPKSEMRKVREIDTSAEREIKIFHGPFITFFYVFLINDLLASFNYFFFEISRKKRRKKVGEINIWKR